MSLTTFNSAPPAGAEAAILACCASRTLAATVAAGRPYASADALCTAIESAFATLSWDDILEAMAGHPRIGDRVSGTSAAEQSGVTDSSRAALIAANREYEARFGHVFLICASGLSGEEMLAALRKRLNNPPSTERDVTIQQLLKITLLRARDLAAS